MKDEKTPRRMKTVENPVINAREFIIVSFLISALLPVLKSSKEIPVIKDTYDGISGRTQGDRKDNKPPTKANV
jgi:hypothetical protein